MTIQLDEIVALSKEFGTSDSVKDAQTLWVKPSGTTLAGMTPASFVAMNRAAMQRLYALAVPADAHAREALVKDVMAAAVVPGSSGRPSVEAPLHELLSGLFVVHTHPALVNGMTCSRDGAKTCARLFPDALWIPYIDPGFTLCMDVRNRVREFAATAGRQPVLLFLENHGVFITGDTMDDIRSLYRRVMESLGSEYARAGVATALPKVASVAEGSVNTVKAALSAAMGAEAACVSVSGPFKVAAGPVSPDHIVYSKSYAYVGDPTKAGIEAFRSRHGYLPKVVVTPTGVFGVAAAAKQAALALELALDGALVCQLAQAFGGIQYMTDRARLFIENWEVESYRQKQV